MADQKFRLKWNTFEEDIRGVNKEIRELGDFSDVTLVCEDGEEEGHRVLLATASPLLRALLREHRPTLRLSGLHLSTLRSILDFIYLGEVSLEQEELATFLAAARGLQLRGLGGVPALGGQAGVGHSGAAGTKVKGLEEQVGKTMEAGKVMEKEVGKAMEKEASKGIKKVMGKVLEKPGVRENKMQVGHVGERQGVKVVVDKQKSKATGKKKWRVDGKVRDMVVPEKVKVGLVEEQKEATKDKALKALGKVVEENNNLVECGEVSSPHSRTLSGMELNVVLDGMVEVVVGEGVRCTTCCLLFTNKTRAMLHCELHLQLAQPCLMCSKAFGSRATLSRHYFEDHSLKYISPFAL